MLAISSSKGYICSIWKNGNYGDYWESKYCIKHYRDGYYLFSAKTGYGEYFLEDESHSDDNLPFYNVTNSDYYVNTEWIGTLGKVKRDGEKAYYYNEAAMNHEYLSPTILKISTQEVENGVQYTEELTDDTSFVDYYNFSSYTVWECENFSLKHNAKNVFKPIKGRLTEEVTIVVKQSDYFKKEDYYYNPNAFGDYEAAGIYFLYQNGEKTSSAICVGVQHYGLQGTIKNYPYMYNGKLEYVDLQIKEYKFVKDVEKTTIKGKIYGKETVIETDKYKNPSIVKFYAKTSLGFYIDVDIKVKFYYNKHLFYYTKREALDPNIPKEDKVTFTTSIEIKEKNEKGEEVIRNETLENELFFYCTEVTNGDLYAYKYIFDVPLWTFGD